MFKNQAECDKDMIKDGWIITTIQDTECFLLMTPDYNMLCPRNYKKIFFTQKQAKNIELALKQSGYSVKVQYDIMKRDSTGACIKEGISGFEFELLEEPLGFIID